MTILDNQQLYNNSIVPTMTSSEIVNGHGMNQNSESEVTIKLSCIKIIQED